MAKKSVWVWVGIIAAVVLIVFSLCICSVVGYVYYMGQKSAEAKKHVDRAASLLKEADDALAGVESMNTVLPSNKSAASAAVAAAADLPGAREKLTEAKGYLTQASDVGAGGDVGKYVEAKLASTSDKIEICDMRQQQAKELDKAMKAASLANAALPLMDKGIKYINDSAAARNRDQYSKAASLLQKGNAMTSKAQRYYTQAQATYPKASYNICIQTLKTARVAVRYKSQLDKLGQSGQVSKYNVVRLKSNSTWHKAFNLWKRTDKRDDGTVVDKAYAAVVDDLVTRINEKTASAKSKDSQAGTL